MPRSLMQKFHEMLPAEIIHSVGVYQDMGLLKEVVAYVDYDIDFDVIKIRFWKELDGKLITKKWQMPSFANEERLWDWVSSRLYAFERITEDEEEAAAEGYIKGKTNG